MGSAISTILVDCGRNIVECPAAAGILCQQQHGILVAIAIFRASGALTALENLVRPLTAAIGMPSEALPMALMRPLSGSGATGIMMETMTQPGTGPDTFVGMLVSTLQGSTETTFYVLALYFGAARISNGRHALVTCLTADAAGILGAVAACRFFFPELF